MTIAYGVTATGFVSKPATQIKTEFDAAFLGTALGASAGTDADGSIPPQSLAGQIIAIMTDGISGCWDLAGGAYSAFDPTQAAAAALDAVTAITGTTRNGAVASAVTITCVGANGTVLPGGRTVTTSDTLSRFDSVATATLTATATWAASTAYATGTKVTLGGNVYLCTTAGTSAGSGGPTGTGTAITDGGVTWRYLGAGTAYADVPFLAEVTGPVGAAIGSLTVISTPVAGWATAYNAAAAAPGSTQETDAALRVRRESELHSEGLAATDAIRAAMLRVDAGTANAVTSCTVFVNNTDTTDANGVPPHAVEILVIGGVDADVAAAVWASVGAGTATHGNYSATVTDASGNLQTVYWSRPTQVPIYVTANVTYDSTAGAFPANGAALLQGALLTFGSTYAAGRDVRASALVAALFEGPTSAAPGAVPCPGVLDAAVLISTSPTPTTSAPIAITARQIATFAASRTIVNLTGAAP